MKPLKNTRIVFFCVVLAAFICLLAIFAGSSYAQQEPQTNWLSQFTRGVVRITFATKPPDMEQIMEVRLISVERAGLVLRFSQRNDMFCPYSQIISIDPL